MKIQLRIFLIFSIIFFSSFLPENYHTFFGDWMCQGSGTAIPNQMYYSGCNYLNSGYHNSEWHWGFRHYIWILMGLTMTIVNISKIIYDETK